MRIDFNNYNFPDDRGHFMKYGGKYVPETLIPALNNLEKHFKQCINSSEFKLEFDNLLKDYSGRETPLYLANEISKELGYNIWLKREDLNHTGAHKINNALGQALLAI